MVDAISTDHSLSSGHRPIEILYARERRRQHRYQGVTVQKRTRHAVKSDVDDWRNAARYGRPVRLRPLRVRCRLVSSLV